MLEQAKMRLKRQEMFVWPGIGLYTMDYAGNTGAAKIWWNQMKQDRTGWNRLEQDSICWKMMEQAG